MSQAYAREQDRKRRALGLGQAWIDGHQRRLSGSPEIVRHALISLVRERAGTIVSSNRSDPVIISQEDYDEMMNRLITQIRRHRHGQIDNTTQAEWESQCTAISAELGHVWRVARKEAA